MEKKERKYRIVENEEQIRRKERKVKIDEKGNDRIDGKERRKRRKDIIEELGRIDQKEIKNRIKGKDKKGKKDRIEGKEG